MTQQQLESLLRQVAPVASGVVELPSDRRPVLAAAQMLTRAEIDAAIDAVFPAGKFEVFIENARQDANEFFKSVLKPKK
ncbi:hypothetical protein [Myxococcus qinghaiensis]|uniref:hypothetical protein n=1 Tax=Myxococcus qinghaiensis TaxID=2906758 RepID=UPI0020A6DB37|nr:hypothetical protein [Myxococcus qinghaiensis]MCP3163151.1 hypothetical protein [Myxococcus qinghaiensis]